jgi:DNA-binding response OmpR family regulator
MHISALFERNPARATPPPRVLIADDSPEMLGLLSAWLEDEGCIVIAVGSGRDALDAAMTYRPEVAFLDLVLPPPDGFHLCEMFRSSVGPAVVLMTGMSNPDTRRVSDVGAVMLLRKPFTRENVVDALTLALEQCRREGASGGAAFAVR